MKIKNCIEFKNQFYIISGLICFIKVASEPKCFRKNKYVFLSNFSNYGR